MRCETVHIKAGNQNIIEKITEGWFRNLKSDIKLI